MNYKKDLTAAAAMEGAVQAKVDGSIPIVKVSPEAVVAIPAATVCCHVEKKRKD